MFMRNLLLFLSLFAVGFTTAQGQSGRAEYLREVGRDMRCAGFFRGADSARIFGFGTIPGRAGTEEAELALISDILSRTDTLYYFMETDYATAYRFNRYLATGDGALLRELVSDYGRRVPPRSGAWKSTGNGSGCGRYAKAKLSAYME